MRMYIKGDRNLLQIVQSDVPRLALDMGNECSMQSCLKGERLLRPSFRASQHNDIRCQKRPSALSCPIPGGIHAPECQRQPLLRQPRLSHNLSDGEMMFVTHAAFMHCLQLDDQSTMWTSMEVALQRPWFLATVIAPDGVVKRTFALGTNEDLLLFADSSPLGTLVSLQLVLAPHGDTSAWRITPIVAVSRLVHNRNPRPAVVVTTQDGVHYGGAPVKRLTLRNHELMPLLQLPAAPNAAHGRSKPHRPSGMGPGTSSGE